MKLICTFDSNYIPDNGSICIYLDENFSAKNIISEIDYQNRKLKENLSL